MTQATGDNHASTLRGQFHATCSVCGQSHGLGLQFELAEDGSVLATFDCPRQYEGYDGIIHGGIVASLLDGAMTNCLFQAGHIALTADLRVRFRHPLQVGIPATVRAWIMRTAGPLFYLAAEVSQDGQVRAKGLGTFFDRNDKGVPPCEE